MADSLVIRPLKRPEYSQLYDFAAREGWKPSLHDGDAFFAADPAGFLGGFLKGELVGCISLVRYDASFAFLGLYIVHPAFRGQGIGIALWNAAMELAGPRTVGLDGVVAQQGNYRKSGFTLAHRNVRHSGMARDDGGPDPTVPIESLDTEGIRRFDLRAFGAARHEFLKHWASRTRSIGRGLVVDGHLNGYGVVRSVNESESESEFKVGPLFADSPWAAERILSSLVSRLPAESNYFLDIPEPNGPAQELARRFDLRPVFETARMYKGPPPEINNSLVYGVTTFELG